MEKTCRKCGETKLLEDFHCDRRTADGFTRQCKECRLARNREYRTKNRRLIRSRERESRRLEPERHRARRRRYYWRHRDLELERSRGWREANPEKHRENARRWRSQNAERIRAARERWAAANPDYQARWYESNRERHLENCHRNYESNPEYQRERARRYYRENAERWREYEQRRRVKVGAADPELIAYMVELLNDPCAYCGQEAVEIDHIEPLSRGGEHKADNLAPACMQCNRSKGAKPLSEWPGPGSRLRPSAG